jgi:CelD/BcsL family acetyltransferase involved in cellulose biosynthesis
VDNTIAPFVRLPASWDEYLATRLGRNARQKARRFLNRLDAGGPLAVTHATPQTVERDTRILETLWTDNWGARKGDDLPKLRAFIRRGGPAFVGRGAGDIPILWHGDRPIAVHLLWLDPVRRTQSFAFGGRDRSVTSPPPGFLLHCYSIRRAIRERLEIYDFLRGDEDYKYVFGVEERRLSRFIIHPAERAAEQPARVDQHA